MQEWFSQSELVGLVGLPSTVRSIRRKAQAEGWRSQPRQARGGGSEYHFSSLPLETQQHIAKAYAATLKVEQKKEKKPEAVKPSLHNMINAFSSEEKARLNARLSLISAWESFHKRSGLSMSRSMAEFTDKYESEDLDISGEIYTYVPSLSVPTLKRWRKDKRDDNFAKLAGAVAGKHRKGTGIIESNTEMRDLLVGIIQQKPHANAAHLMRIIRSKYKPQDVPAYRTVQRFLKTYLDENKVLHEALTNPDSYKSKFAVAYGNASEHITSVNGLWELDSSPADVICTDGIRYNLMAAIDIYTRRAKILVTRTSDAEGVCALMRKCILEWGVPEAVKTDNGKDYVSNRFTTALSALDIRQEISTPYSPEQKPHIERFFRTQSMQLLEMMPGYIGHNVADRKKIEERKAFAKRLEAQQNGVKDEVTFDAQMSAEELQEVLDLWCEDIYERSEHGGLNGKTPLQVFTEWNGTVKTIESERALDILLADTYGKRVVSKKGIRADGAYFIAPELALHINEEVRVYHDPQDLGRVYIYSTNDLENPFICEAICPERTGIDRREIGKAAKVKQRNMIKKGRKEAAKIARKVKPQDMITQYLTEQAEQAGKVTVLPKAKEQHETEMLSSVLESINAPKAIERNTISDSAQKHLEKLAKAPKAQVIKIESASVKFKRWMDINAKLIKGSDIDESEIDFWKNYQETNEFKGQKKAREGFGESVVLAAVNAN